MRALLRKSISTLTEDVCFAGMFSLNATTHFNNYKYYNKILCDFQIKCVLAPPLMTFVKSIPVFFFAGPFLNFVSQCEGLLMAFKSFFNTGSPVAVILFPSSKIPFDPETDNG